MLQELLDEHDQRLGGARDAIRAAQGLLEGLLSVEDAADNLQPTEGAWRDWIGKCTCTALRSVVQF